MIIKFDTETIRMITLFENLTNVRVKDCLIDNATNTVYFIVESGKIGIAIGKNGISAKRIEKVTGKNIKIYEYSENLEKFVKNLIPQSNEVKVKNENGKIIVEIKVDKTNRGIVIGRDEKKLKLYKEILQRNHKVDDLVVR